MRREIQRIRAVCLIKGADQSHAASSYLAEDVPNLPLTVSNVVTIDAERTFWDKVVILHGQHR